MEPVKKTPLIKKAVARARLLKTVVEIIDHRVKQVPPLVSVGPVGPKGDRGVKGEAGVPGEKGERGLVGLTGPKGDVGDRGAKGDKGDRGEVGGVGKDGKRGEKGDTGDRGAPGKQGLQGIRGVKGDKGDRGEVGKQGLVGKIGAKGERGEPGKNGRDGKDGKNAALPDITAQIEKIRSEYEQNQRIFISKINQSISSMAWAGSGGGSSNILDNDDVLFKQLSQVSNNAVLVFNSTLRKFEPLNLATVINNIKTELELKYTKLLDKDGTITYIGEAEPGSSEAAAVWRIQRVDETSDPDLEIKWAEGAASFDKVWDDRLTYSYS